MSILKNPKVSYNIQFPLFLKVLEFYRDKPLDKVPFVCWLKTNVLHFKHDVKKMIGKMHLPFKLRTSLGMKEVFFTVNIYCFLNALGVIIFLSVDIEQE